MRILFFCDLYKVLTKDSVTVSVDAVVYYRVSNATVSVANVENGNTIIKTRFINVPQACIFILSM